MAGTAAYPATPYSTAEPPTCGTGNAYPGPYPPKGVAQDAPGTPPGQLRRLDLSKSSCTSLQELVMRSNQGTSVEEPSKPSSSSLDILPRDGRIRPFSEQAVLATTPPSGRISALPSSTGLPGSWAPASIPLASASMMSGGGPGSMMASLRAGAPGGGSTVPPGVLKGAALAHATSGSQISLGGWPAGMGSSHLASAVGASSSFPPHPSSVMMPFASMGAANSRRGIAHPSSALRAGGGVGQQVLPSIGEASGLASQMSSSDVMRRATWQAGLSTLSDGAAGPGPSSSQGMLSGMTAAQMAELGLVGPSSPGSLTVSQSFPSFPSDSSWLSGATSGSNPESMGAARGAVGPGESLPRPASMPALMGAGSGLMFDPGSAGNLPRRKGRGGRTAAMDPRLDPSIDPKRAKRILANRQSAARSKNKQRGHLDTLEHAQSVLIHQKSELLKEAAWLRSEVKSMEEDTFRLEAQLKALEEHVLLQEALQMKLLEDCGQSPALEGQLQMQMQMGMQMQIPSLPATSQPPRAPPVPRRSAPAK